MRKLALLAILILSMIAIVSNQKFYGQQGQLLPLSKRINLFENNLEANHKPYKMIGENKCNPNGKIVQKITTNQSFEIVALPLIEATDSAYYPRDFAGALYASNGYKLSEATSKYGIRLKTKLPEENQEKKTHKFEFTNPNENPVKVRFYIVQVDPIN
jgi:hypothetical protein